MECKGPFGIVVFTHDPTSARMRNLSDAFERTTLKKMLYILHDFNTNDDNANSRQDKPQHIE